MTNDDGRIPPTVRVPEEVRHVERNEREVARTL
jgi:hypothetical protein